MAGRIYKISGHESTHIEKNISCKERKKPFSQLEDTEDQSKECFDHTISAGYTEEFTAEMCTVCGTFMSSSQMMRLRQKTLELRHSLEKRTVYRASWLVQCRILLGKVTEGFE